MTHECKSLPTSPDERERRGEGWLRGYTTSCGHGHLGFQQCFYCKNKCVVTILPCQPACLPPVPSTACVSRRKWLAAQGTVAKLALGASLWVASGAAAGPGLPTALQLHLLRPTAPMASRGAGSIGRTGQQLLEPHPFLLAARMESRGQWEGGCGQPATTGPASAQLPFREDTSTGLDRAGQGGV